MMLFILLAPFLGRALGLPGRAACQSLSANAADWRARCPPNTTTVGQGQQYASITAALQALPNNDTPYTLLVYPGTYTEQVNVTRRGPLTLLGATDDPNANTKNAITIIWKAATGTKETGNRDNAFTSTLTVAPNLEASLTGSGPTGHQLKQIPPYGNTDFRAYNIDFVNNFKPYSAGPSLAVSVSFANAAFYFCNIRSYQDTVYIGKSGNAYFYGGEVAGQTDFLYGFGTAWLQKVKLALRGCGGGITAWKGTATSSPNKYGVYINDSRIEKANATLNLKGKCSLGRPWNELHRSIFAHSYMDDSIQPSGYSMWGGAEKRFSSSTFMAEYSNTGPGYHVEARRAGKLSKLLSSEEFALYDKPEKVFVGQNGAPNISWIDLKPEEK